MSDSRGPVSTRLAARPRRPDPARHFLVYCDESGIDDGPVMGFGSLWITYERRGDFARLWGDLRQSHFAPSEAKWNKVKPKTFDFFKAAVDAFFDHRWIMFHCIILGKNEVDLSLHDRDWDLARRKHFTLFLANKLVRFAKPQKFYRIRVDPLPSRYKKADEAAEVILRNLMQQKRNLRRETIHSLRTVDSRDTPGIQLCDILLGAIVSARRNNATAAAKLALRDHIAGRLGWPSLEFDTLPREWKFNIWRFWDPTSGTPRPESTKRSIAGGAG